MEPDDVLKIRTPSPKSFLDAARICEALETGQPPQEKSKTQKLLDLATQDVQEWLSEKLQAHDRGQGNVELYIDPFKLSKDAEQLFRELRNEK